MTEEIAKSLVCPECRAGDLQSEPFDIDRSGAIKDGVLICTSCGNWFPIEDNLLELLAGPLAYREDRQKFWQSHERELRALDLTLGNLAADRDQASDKLLQQDHFDWYAKNDTQTYSAYEETPFWRAADEIAFSEWRKLVRPDDLLLDVGCAQGRSTFPLLAEGVRAVGFDISKAMIQKAIERVEAENCSDRAVFFVGDAAAPPLADACFDIVLIYGVLHHLPDPAETCRHVSRMLKPGGVYLGQENNRSAMRFAFDLLQKIVPIWHEEAGAQPTMCADDFRSWFRDLQVDVSTRTRVFAPPHVMNLLGRKGAFRFLSSTDNLFHQIPWFRDQGGLILVKGDRVAG